MRLHTPASCLCALLLSACAKPVADFTAAVPDETAPATVTFVNSSERAESYLWDFGDGDTTRAPNPEHRYATSGNYLVTLTARRGDRTSVDSQRVQIVGPIACLIEITTPLGRMVAQLSDETPKHRDNFIKLAEEGYYDGLLFHRIIDGFMIQGGDPDSRGASPSARLGGGGPGYQVDAEFVEGLAHTKGALAAARTGDAVNPQRRSSGSQFYIVTGRSVTEAELDQMEARKGITYTPETREAYLRDGGVPFLDADYTVYGQVIEGLDVLDAIGQVVTGAADRPEEDVTMQVRVIK